MKNPSKSVRLQKLIASCGITSRRKAEELIVQGRVKVNNEIVFELGTKVDPEEDMVQVDEQLLEPTAVDHVYFLMHKPRACVTTVSDPQGRETVMDLLPELSERVFPVGRLDYLSEGLLLLTNDGELANKIMHPRYAVQKVYEVKVFGVVTPEILKKLRKGVKDKGELLKPQSVRIVGQLYKKTWLEFRLIEGKNREIRRLCDAVGLVIDKLRRVAIEGLSIQGIKSGDWRILSKQELMKALNMDPRGEFAKEKKHQFTSVKRSLKLDGKIRIKKSERRRQQGKRLDPSRSADDPFFQMFKKEQYYETLKGMQKKQD